MTEQQPYQIEQEFTDFEVRRYPEHLLAEVIIEGSFEDAGNRAFRYLFSYIGGENRSNRKIAMTAPVVQAKVVSETIAMTAPVIQTGVPGQSGAWTVRFIMPAAYTLDNGT